MLTRTEADALIAAIESMIDPAAKPRACDKCGGGFVQLPALIGERVEACPACEAALVSANRCARCGRMLVVSDSPDALSVKLCEECDKNEIAARKVRAPNAPR